MAVDTYALTDVATLSAYLDDPVRAAITVYHDESSSATAATVEVTSTAVVLIITGGANAGTNTLTLSSAANDTLTELVDVINALAIGWVASLSGAGDATSGDLVITSSTSAFGSALTQTLNIRDVFLMELIIDGVSGDMERYLDRKVIERAYTEWHNAQSGRSITLEQRPVTTINRIAYGRRPALTVTNTNSVTGTTTECLASVTSTAIVLKRTTSATTTTDATALFATSATVTAIATVINALGNGWSATITPNMDNFPTADLAQMHGSHCQGVNVELELPGQAVSDYRTDNDKGRVHLGAFTSTSGNAKQNLFVDYTAGFATTSIEYKAIKKLATEICAAYYGNAASDESLIMEKLGDYQYKRAEAGMAEEVIQKYADRLNRFVRHSVLVGV